MSEFNHPRSPLISSYLMIYLVFNSGYDHKTISSSKIRAKFGTLDILRAPFGIYHLDLESLQF